MSFLNQGHLNVAYYIAVFFNLSDFECVFHELELFIMSFEEKLLTQPCDPFTSYYF